MSVRTASAPHSTNETNYPQSASPSRLCFTGPRKPTPLYSSDSCDPLPLSSTTMPIRASTIEGGRRIPRLTTTTKKQLTVRALFDYDPSADNGLPGRGLAFHHGDILHVVNATDQEWWQARRLTLYSDTNLTSGLNSSPLHSSNSISFASGSPLPTRSSLGIIPSRQRVERRQRARLKRVNFFSKVTVIGLTAPPSYGNPAPAGNTPSATADCSQSPTTLTNGDWKDEHSADSNHTSDKMKKTAPNDHDAKSRSNSLTRSFLKRFSSRSRRKFDHLLLTGSPALVNSVSDADLDSVRSYELVKSVTISIARPLLVFGPLKERVIDYLLQDTKFATCVPHTTRHPRPHERDGVDYHFVASKAQMEEDIKSDRFIEVGQFQDQFYATSIDSVRRTLQTGRVCVLDVGLPAIRRLELADLFPIAVLLKPTSPDELRNIQRRLTDEQAKRSVDMAARLEAENWRLFSAIIPLVTVEDAVNTIKQFVLLHGGPVIWVSSGLSNSSELGTMGSQSSTLPRVDWPAPSNSGDPCTDAKS